MSIKSGSLVAAVAAGSIPVAISIMAACCSHLVSIVGQPEAHASQVRVTASPVAPAMATVDVSGVASAEPFAADTASQAAGGITFESELDRGALLAGADGLLRMELRIGSDHEPTLATRRATDLVVVLDESGSMSGAKIGEAKAAARELLSQLSEEDRFSLVSFDSDAQLRIPLGYATAEMQRSWMRRIEGLDAGGGTQMQAGLALGSEQHRSQAGRAARTILISDGLPDTQSGLVEQARSFARSEVPLTTVGIGDDYDEQLMVQLADAGTGNFYWVQAGQDLATVFAHELSTAQETVATGLQVGLELGNGVELVDASGYPVHVVGGRAVFDVGTLYASQERSFWITLRVLADRAGERRVAVPSLSWRAPESVTVASVTLEPSSVEVVNEQRRFLASLDADNWGRSVVEEEYNVMRNEVSQAVQAGDEKTAQALIDDYRDRNRPLNEVVGSQAVWDNFEEVTALEQQVQQQFEGEDQADRQNIFAKTLNSLSYGQRRTGQAKGY